MLVAKSMNLKADGISKDRGWGVECLAHGLKGFLEHYARNIIRKMLGVLIFKPGAAGWEARTLPLYYAAPISKDSYNSTGSTGGADDDDGALLSFVEILRLVETSHRLWTEQKPEPEPETGPDSLRRISRKMNFWMMTKN